MTTSAANHKHVLHYLLGYVFCLLFWVHALCAISQVKARAANNGRASSSRSVVPAIFIFGDSTCDPGNNNFIKTPFKCNFAPYGRDFPNQVPTGRFTNGRLVADFIAQYVGIKDYVPPYLDPSLSIEELMTGVSFASAGSGFDPLTPTISNVIPLQRQVEYFKEYQAKLEAAIGKDKTERIITNGLYMISAGTNDFVVNYFTLPIRRKTYDLPSYMEFMFQHIRHFMQDIMDLGARRIGFAGLTSMGCLPIVITLNSEHAITQRSCIDSYTSAARDFNELLQKELHAIQSNSSFYPGSRIAYMDTYNRLQDMILHSNEHGVALPSTGLMSIEWMEALDLSHKAKSKEVNSGCCGTGILEASFLCNPKSPVCPDASKYIFWDSIHPTEKAYKITFESLRPTIDLLIKG